jgi:hypothetical protein
MLPDAGRPVASKLENSAGLVDYMDYIDNSGDDIGEFREFAD